MAPAVQEGPSTRSACTSPSLSPESCSLPAVGMGACPELTRCLSTASSLSQTSSTDAATRDSLGSDVFSRQSSGSYRSRASDISCSSSRQSSCSLDHKGRRRGYVRPQGTDFAASARSRESVLSLGSIAHLQYYFARTGLLDGKGAQLARKKQLQLQQREAQGRAPGASATDGSAPPAGAAGLASPKIVCSDLDAAYGSFFDGTQDVSASFVESPVDEHDGYYSDDFDDTDPDILPPTVSTYNHKEKPLPRPPSIEELKADLASALDAASKTLGHARRQSDTSDSKPPPPETCSPGRPRSPKSSGWHEVQGMHILDVVTLAIRAAKVYYTAHEQPDRLAAIRSERELRADLLSVMEVLKHMATRNFSGGVRESELASIEIWVESVRDVMRREEEAEATDRAERATWLWATANWTGTALERELAFMRSMDPFGDSLPPWTPAAEASSLPTPFLSDMQSGLKLVRLHNAAVRRSRRRFGAIPSYHEDTMKPYRCAENLRYWVKAAELRWEVALKIDALGIVYDTGPEVWLDFERAILTWCSKVREEIVADLGSQCGA